MSRRRIVYMVSRFPRTSETFIVRELDALARREEFQVELRSLFPAQDTTVHELAGIWTERMRRPHVTTALSGILWALRTRPLAVASAASAVLTEHSRKPRILVRAMVTFALACAHARELDEGGGITHVHAHYATYPALAAWICHRLTGIGYSFTVHAHDLYVDRSMLRRKIADARFVITISEFNRVLLEELNDRATPIEVIHCGIDIARYTYQPREIPAEGPVRALCVASLQEYKGHRFLLDALAAGGPNVARIRLDLIGEGPLEDELRHIAHSLGIADRVSFLGARDETYVLQALSDADLFVLPSVVARNGQMEGLPVALMEALACGLPTVSTAVSGIPEIVIDGVTGYLTQPGDVVGLRDALEEIISNGAVAAKRAGAGRELIEREFVLDDNVRTFARILNSHLPKS
jgi:colanic acid/amylovoran biosynthesis glycosyltransferase